MGNPYSSSVLQNESVQNIMSRIWHCADEGENPNAVQIWSEISGNTSCRVLDFQVNQRSGGDAWFADVLISCREGRMQDEDYRFLHGLPTLHCGSWLSSKDKSSCEQSKCAMFQERTREMRFKSATDWFAEMRASENKYECKYFTHERKRRHRVLWGESLTTRKSLQEYNICAHLHDDLRSERFKQSLYIQMANETVGTQD